MAQLMHFTHSHVLNLVHLQPNHTNESSGEEEKDDNNFVIVAEDHHVDQCNMCKEQINLFHLYYYKCKDCDYSLHKFCAEMPTTLPNHPLHSSHNLTLAEGFQLSHPHYSSDYEWKCGVCNLKRKNFFNYHCSICRFNMDIICATISQQKIDHPSHPHQLERMSKQLVSHCNACSLEHEGTFYHCTTCSWFWIHQDCASLPAKLLIQKPTNGTFTHSHPLTLAYSFPQIEREAKLYPYCRVCDKGFYTFLWFYKCDKCRYYAHTYCATSKIEAFMSIFLPPGRGKAYKNFKDSDHPNLLHCPFPNESSNLLKHHFFNQVSIVETNHDEMLNHFSHQHPLILLDTQTSINSNSIFLHNPMKKIQLLCDGCVKPIIEMPLYKCSKDIRHCGFVLHEWCARLPSKVQNNPGHPEHTLYLMSNIPMKFFGVYDCAICFLPSNGFAYGCRTCEYYIDINCAFLPKEITHEAHPDHLLSKIDTSSSSMEKKICNACYFYIKDGNGYHCPSCDFYLHPDCALLLPKVIRHKYDKHPLSLRYDPVENHPGDYFCDICEEQLNPQDWFYHCSFCVQSMHPTCAPLILQCEQAVYAKYKRLVFRFVNVKFKGTLKIGRHPHCLAFVQGVECHGQCKFCNEDVQYEMAFKCLECNDAIHYECASLWRFFYSHSRFSVY